MNIIYKIKQLKKIRNGSLLSLYTSLFGIFVCILCLAGSTLAWFSAEKNLDTDSIIAADKFLSSLSAWRIEEVSGEPDENGDVDIWNEEYPVSFKSRQYGKSFYADANVLYEIKAVIDGSAENGFLMVETPDGDFYTTNENCSFSLLLSESGSVNISVSWGEETGNAKKFSRGQTLGNGELPVIEIETEICSGVTADGGTNTASGSSTENQSEAIPETNTPTNGETEKNDNISQSEDVVETTSEAVPMPETSDTEPDLKPANKAPVEKSETSSAESVSDTTPSDSSSQSGEASAPTVSQTETTSSTSGEE